MSGWCESLGVKDQWHDECERRMADGWIKSCPCPNHQVSQGVPASATGRMGSKKTAPGGASTPDSQGLADDWSID